MKKKGNTKFSYFTLTTEEINETLTEDLIYLKIANSIISIFRNS